MVLRLGEVAFKRDYLCEFAPAASEFFTRELIDRCLTARFQGWNGGRKPFPEGI